MNTYVMCYEDSHGKRRYKHIKAIDEDSAYEYATQWVLLGYGELVIDVKPVRSES